MQIKSKDKNKKSKGSRMKMHVFFLFFTFFFSLKSFSQCAMCRASLESSGNATQAEAVNDGIVYLMAIPYILVGVIGIFIYNMYFKKPKTN